MAQVLDVNIVPQSYLPEIRVSENDNLLRVIKTNIIDEAGEAYTIPSGVTATFAGTKPSGLGFTIPCTIDGSSVQFVMEDTACNEVGRFPAEIRFMNGDSRIGTCNVMMVVEPNPHPDDTTDGDREPLINEITALLEEIQEEHQRALQDIGAAKDDALDAIAADVQAADAAAQRAQESADQAAKSEARADAAMEAWTNMSAEAETLPAGSDATADYNEGVLSLGIPRGDKGEQGEDGQDGTDGVGIASVALNSDYTLTITLTDGTTYTTTSIRGEQGETGLTPDFSIGNVTTLAPGSQATAAITGTDEEPVLNLGIPKGDPGDVTEAELLKLAIHDEASGSIASFADGSDGFPMDSLKVTLEPVQAGSGDPSPDNVRPITGWDEVNTVVCGKNLLDVDSLVNFDAYDGTMRNGIKISKPGTYTISAKSHTVSSYIYGKTYYPDGTWSQTFVIATNVNHFTVTRTIQEGESFSVYDASQNPMDFSKQMFSDCQVQIEVGSTATAYEPYQGRTITTTLPQTIYGGTLDVVSGVLTVDRVLFEGQNRDWQKSSSLAGRFVTYVGGDTDFPRAKVDQSLAGCSHYDGSSFRVNTGVQIYINSGFTDFSLSDWTQWLAEQKTAGTPLQIYYGLETIQTYQLTPTEVDTLFGQNNIWSDAGDVYVKYVADTKLCILKVISQ